MSLATPALLSVLTTTSMPSTCSKIRNVEGESTKIHKSVSIVVAASVDAKFEREVALFSMEVVGGKEHKCREMVRRSTNSWVDWYRYHVYVTKTYFNTPPSSQKLFSRGMK